MSCTVVQVAEPEKDAVAVLSCTDHGAQNPLDCLDNDALSRNEEADWDGHCSAREATVPLAVDQQCDEDFLKKAAADVNEVTHKEWTGAAVSVAVRPLLRSSHVKGGHWQAFEVDMQHRGPQHCRLRVHSEGEHADVGG